MLCWYIIFISFKFNFFGFPPVDGSSKANFDNLSKSKSFSSITSESLMYSLKHYSNELDFDVINPSSDNNIEEINKKLSSYDGLIWGGSSLNIYDNTPEIKRQI